MLISQLHNREHDKKTLADLMNIMHHYVLNQLFLLRGFPILLIDLVRRTICAGIASSIGCQSAFERLRANKEVLFRSCDTHTYWLLITCVVSTFPLFEMSRARMGVFTVGYKWHFPLYKNVMFVLTRFHTMTQQHEWCAGISSACRRRKEIASLLDWRFSRSHLIKLNNKIQYELIFPLNLLLVPGHTRLDDLSNIRSGISEEPSCCSLFSGLLRETWRSVFSLLQVSKPCYSYALETKHMFSSRLLREPTCYLYPVTRRRETTALASSAFSLSKLPLIKKKELSNQSFSLLPTAFAVVQHWHHCVCVCVCVWLASPMPHLHIKKYRSSLLSSSDDNCSKSKARHTCNSVKHTATCSTLHFK